MYYFTNESLEAIIAGLEPKSDDLVLAVCGSGDQAFALLEFGCQIITTDQNPQQIYHAKNNYKLLKNKQFLEFVNLNVSEEFLDDERYLARENYFQQNSYLNKISNNLNQLSFFPGNIFKKIPEKMFSKIYLSNVFNYNFMEIEEQKQSFKNLSSKLKNNGLIYVSQGIFLPEQTQHSFFNSLYINERLTIKARKLEKYWNPVIYKKSIN